MVGYARAVDGSDAKAVEEKNRDSFTLDGWLRSGDKGCMNEQGYFRITGRYKELIKTSGGEYVSPATLEEAVLQRAPALSRVVVVGNGRKHVVALVTLQQRGATGETPGDGVLTGLAARVSPTSTTTEQAVDDPAWVAYVRSAIAGANADPVACASRAAAIKKFTILPRDFSIETGELTSTFKLKRSVTEKMYAKAIDAMYDEKLPQKQMFVPFVPQ